MMMMMMMVGGGGMSIEVETTLHLLKLLKLYALRKAISSLTQRTFYAPEHGLKHAQHTDRKTRRIASFKGNS